MPEKYLKGEEVWVKAVVAEDSDQDDIYLYLQKLHAITWMGSKVIYIHLISDRKDIKKKNAITNEKIWNRGYNKKFSDS